MRDSFDGYFVGLDIGTSAIRCVIGSVADDEPATPSIIGYGSALNLGMRKGVVVHPDDVAQAINMAISEAERMAGIQVKNATININGSHIQGVDSHGVIAISSPTHDINEQDRRRVEEAATILQLPPNREIIQVFVKSYRVDGQENIKDPVGMQGVRLEVDTHIVTASSPSVRTLEAACEKAHIRIANRTVNSLAAAEAVLNRQQREAGCVVIDIGAGTTNLTVIEDGEVQHVAVVPMGGLHITHDLAIGLRCDLEVAEQVKIKHASLEGKSAKNKVSVSVNGETHNFDTSDINMVVEARAEEILEYVHKELSKVGKAGKLPGGAVLVGGTVKLPGIDEFTKERLQLAARKGSLQPITGLVDTIQDPSYISTIGLMQLDMLLSPHHHGNSTDINASSLFGWAANLIKQFKKK